MFCLFISDLLKDFWMNSENDIFIENTISKLRLEKDSVDLIFYPELYDVPSFYEFDQNKKLIIKKEIITIEEVQSTNEAGEPIVVQNEIKSYVVDKEIEPVVFFAKGVMVKPC